MKVHLFKFYEKASIISFTPHEKHHKTTFLSKKFSQSDQTLDCIDLYGLQSTLAIFGKINFANSQHQIMNNGSSLDSSLLLYSKQICKDYFIIVHMATTATHITSDHIESFFFQIHLSVKKEEVIIFYTDILTGKVVLWCFFTSETSEKIQNSTFLVKISVQNVIFSSEMEK